MCLAYTPAQSNETNDCYENRKTQNVQKNVQSDLKVGNSY